MNTTLALLSVPMIEVERGPFGARLGETTGQINGWPLQITLTNCELHIQFADRDGPGLVFDINHLATKAINELERPMALPLRSPHPAKPMRPRR